MNIYINNEKIDFQLQDETNLSDVIAGIDAELLKAQGQLLSVKLNGIRQCGDESMWNKVAIADIHDLHIEADSNSNAQLKLLLMINEYLIIIKSAHNERIYPDNLEKEDLQEILLNVDSLVFGGGDHHSPLRNLLYYVFQNIGLFSDDKVITAHKEIDSILTHITHIIQARVLVLIYGNTQSHKLTQHIKNTIKDLAMVVDYIDEGKDILIVNVLVGYINVLIQWMKVCSANTAHTYDSALYQQWKQTHGEHARQLSEILAELSVALDAKDMITISDLIEYEIVPKTIAYAEDMLDVCVENV